MTRSSCEVALPEKVALPWGPGFPTLNGRVEVILKPREAPGGKDISEAAYLAASGFLRRMDYRGCILHFARVHERDPGFPVVVTCQGSVRSVWPFGVSSEEGPLSVPGKEAGDARGLAPPGGNEDPR